MRISCLHTTPLNIPVYEAAAPEGVHLTHHVRSDLSYRARQGVDAGLKAETNMYLSRMAAGSDAVLLTCSILSGVVALPAFAADALLAETVAAAAPGKTVDVFYSDIDATAAIEERFGAIPGAARLRLVPVSGAMERLLQDDTAGHDRLVTDAVKKCDADLVVLVQATLQRAVPAADRILGSARVALHRIACMETSG